jgi:RNA polymerase sigma factor (sigma-70 family)
MSVTRVGLPVERMDDEALLAGLATGDTEVALAFVRRFQARIYAVALAVVGDPASAEDVAQQTFERVWLRASTFDRQRGGVRAWLTTIARNTALDSIRRRKPVPIDPIDLIRLLGPTDDEPETASIRRESAAELRSALRHLPAEQARALVMAGIYRMTAQEVADAEAIPLGTAKTRIRVAMTKVRAHLPVREATGD